MKVYNLKGKSGRPVVNQFIIKDDNRKVFQSYDSTIVEVKGHDCITIGRFVIRYYEGMR